MAIILLLAAGAGYLALNYHIIIFDDRLKLLKKTEYSLNNVIVDARGANLLKLATQPDLIKAGIMELLGQSKGATVPTKPPQPSN